VHGGIGNECRVEVEYVDSEEIESEGLPDVLQQVDGILVPGGFGQRGTEGKIEAIRFARENRVPYFGICLGMQLAVAEFARSMAGLEGANSSELNENCPHSVIDLMPEQEGVTQMGGTMRLGAYPCRLLEGTRTFAAYGKKEISERHRHRYEVNNDYREILQEKGLVLSGLSPDGRLVEMIEIPDHPWFVGCQFHPEFKSRPMEPHPLFRVFIGAAVEHRRAREEPRGLESDSRQALSGA
jgi:CTP synthase